MKLNFICFLCLIIGLVVIMFCCDNREIETQIVMKPWHMQRTEQTDLLSDFYQSHYERNDRSRLTDLLQNNGQRTVLILVDAWGVPYEHGELEEEFALFDGLPVKKIIQRRHNNTTLHAEKTEFRKKDSVGTFLLGGDSLEYNRKEYIPLLGYDKLIFCQSCPDEIMFAKLDSILNLDSMTQTLALTTQSSRNGDRANLLKSLKQIRELMQKHPEAVFIVQGTHRPVLVPGKIRDRYYENWVPALIVGNQIKH